MIPPMSDVVDFNSGLQHVTFSAQLFYLFSYYQTLFHRVIRCDTSFHRKKIYAVDKLSEHSRGIAKIEEC